MIKKAISVFFCMLMILTTFSALGKTLIVTEPLNENNFDNGKNDIKVQAFIIDNSTSENSYPVPINSDRGTYWFGVPNDDTPITVYTLQTYGTDWDSDRGAWRYKCRFDWYQAKHGAAFGDPDWDEWPYVVLEVDLSIDETNTVYGSLNDFAHGGWNVHEGGTHSYPYQDIALVLCNLIISCFPYVGMAFSTGLSLAGALRDAPAEPLYTWMGQQIYEGDGFFQLDFYVYPNEEAQVISTLDIWGSSVDRGYQDYGMYFDIQVTAPGKNYAPDKPNPPTGPSEGQSGTSYQYTGNAPDPNSDDDVYVQFDWGDGTTSGWIGPVPEGDYVSSSHTWDEGTYGIKVRGKDEWDYIGPWSDPKTITMPLSHPDFYLSLIPQELQNILASKTNTNVFF